MGEPPMVRRSSEPFVSLRVSLAPLRLSGSRNMERTMLTSTILWKRLDAEGHDSASLADVDDGWLLHGTAVFDAEGQAARLDYRVRCDRQWKLVEGTIDGWV